MASSSTTSILILGRKSITYSAPRYTSVCPFCRPKPLTSLTVIPVMPTSCSAFFTSSSLNGLMIASIFFIAFHLALTSTGLLHCLAVKRQVEALALNFGLDPKPDRKIDQFEQDQRDDDIIDDRDRDP